MRLSNVEYIGNGPPLLKGVVCKKTQKTAIAEKTAVERIVEAIRAAGLKPHEWLGVKQIIDSETFK